MMVEQPVALTPPTKTILAATKAKGVRLPRHARAH